MANTGWKSAGTVVNCGDGASYTWHNPLRVKNDDSYYADSDIAKNYSSDTLACTNFGFSIPAGATIDGIQVLIRRGADISDKVKDNVVRLTTNGCGNEVGDYKGKSTYWPASKTTVYYPSSTEYGDDWNAGLSASQVNSSGFGVCFKAMASASAEARCWYIAMRVFYTEVVPPTVTTNACSNQQSTSLQANGEISATGGQNCHTRGFCYIEGTSGDPTTADSKVYDDGGGSYGTGSYNKVISGLTPGTSYRVRAYAINTYGGTGYGTTVTCETAEEVSRRSGSFFKVM